MSPSTKLKQKLIVFSGFLGAGKTMAILSLARRLSAEAEREKTQREAAAKEIGAGGAQTGAGNETTDAHVARYEKKAVIIENEIGDVSFDKSMLRKEGLEVLNMLSGCICCTMSGDLTTQLRELVPWYNPEYVIFEPTGLAFPGKIIETVRESAEDVEWIRTVTVVDAKRFGLLMEKSPLLIRSQIEAADFVLVNKKDLVDAESLTEITRQVREMNQAARITALSARQGVPDEVWEELLR